MLPISWLEQRTDCLFCRVRDRSFLKNIFKNGMATYLGKYRIHYWHFVWLFWSLWYPIKPWESRFYDTRKDL